jgi:hypothetical protein
LVLPALLLAGASGCASLSTSYSRGPAVDPAALVQVNRQLQIPSGRARVYLLDGEPLEGDAPNTWDTYCSVLMQTVHQAGEPRLTVEPDSFEISEVREYNDRRFAPRIYVATTVSMLEDWPANIVYSVEMRLHSPRQPGVRALICSRHSGAEMHSNTRAYYPDLVQIRAALGEVIEIIEP